MKEQSQNTQKKKTNKEGRRDSFSNSLSQFKFADKNRMVSRKCKKVIFNNILRVVEMMILVALTLLPFQFSISKIEQPVSCCCHFLHQQCQCHGVKINVVFSTIKI